MKKALRRLDGWYQKKTYSHFDAPLSFQEADRLVRDVKWVETKSFWPFIGFVESQRRFGKQRGIAIVKQKDRPLRYCSHQDGYIHSFYASQLSPAYERTLSEIGCQDVVIGYRKGLGTNVDMAKAAFDEIRQRGDCTVLAFDIEGFFESIDHHVLKENLQKVLGTRRLTADWYKVFRSMTQYSWVDIEAVAQRLGFKSSKPPRPICSADEFRLKIRGGDKQHTNLLNQNRKNYGIPQGSPISAVFSNVYMIGFDAACSKQFEALGAFYRRYSDDIIVVCNPGQEAMIERIVSEQLASLGPSMKINSAKTECSKFQRSPSGELHCDTPVTYLGLTFDGRRTLLRGRTLSRFYRRMSYATRHAAKAARDAGSNVVFKRKLNRDLTHLGSANFYSYAKRAATSLHDSAPLRQLRNHVQILKRKLEHNGR